MCVCVCVGQTVTHRTSFSGMSPPAALMSAVSSARASLARRRSARSLIVDERESRGARREQRATARRREQRQRVRFEEPAGMKESRGIFMQTAL